MSGTSLDGLDIAYCTFSKRNNHWNFEIIHATTVPYSESWVNRLSNAASLSAFEFSFLDIDYGKFIGQSVKKFVLDTNIKPDFISSHGHTIFHQPEKGITVQIGNGASIAAETQIKVICDFRTLDVAFRGQGAPLVPIGDMELFADYDTCVNIGGFANISYAVNSKRIAYDICPANIVLNHFANDLNHKFDKNGEIARQGKCSEQLMTSLNNISYYHQNPPKSLGKEWLVTEFLPYINRYKLNTEDNLRTLTEHIGFQIAVDINKSAGRKTLITGGGTFNTFLIEQIAMHCNSIIEIPAPEIINYKEALIFAFLGVLRDRNETNCLKSVTGAITDNCGGAIYHGIIQ